MGADVPTGRQPPRGRYPGVVSQVVYKVYNSGTNCGLPKNNGRVRSWGVLVLNMFEMRNGKIELVQAIVGPTTSGTGWANNE
jgi:hypothetical protein